MKMRNEVLFVNKDSRDAQIAALLVQYLGFEEPTIVAEAQALDVWTKAGRVVTYRGPEKYDSLHPWDFDIEDILHTLKPKVVIAGLSWPMNLEAKAIEEARKKGIYTVAIVGNWGAHLRGPVADMYLCIDALAAKLVTASFSASNPNIKVIVVGDMAVVDQSTIDPKLDDIMTRLSKRGQTVLWGSQKLPESIDSLKLACTSLAYSYATGYQFSFIPRIHPGASDADKKLWREYLHSRAFELPVVWLDEEYGIRANSDYLSMLADVTIAATGTGLRAAAHNWRLPVCTWTPALSKKLEEEGADPIHPLVSAGAAYSLNQPCNLLGELKKVGNSILACQSMFLTAKPFNPELAAEAIKAAVNC